MKIFTRKDLDGPEGPTCNCGRCDAEHGRTLESDCHIGAGHTIEYHAGVLIVRCHACKELVAKFQVAYDVPALQNEPPAVRKGWN